MYKSYTFYVTPKVIFGLGSTSLLGEELAALGGRKPLVITDAGIVKVGLQEKATEALKGANIRYSVFDGVEANPRVDTIHKAAEMYAAEGCDSLVAFGGGSSIDTAKATGVIAVHGGHVLDYIGVGKVTKPLPPFIAIPTTAGTGAEVTIFAVVTDLERRSKVPVISPLVVPKTAILDPTLLAHLPPHIAAPTGMDALTHAVEAYTNTDATPLTMALALQSIRLIGANLRAFVAKSQNMEAASNMLWASCIASMSFSGSRLGNVHAMTSPVGGHFDVPHGIANAILLPVVMEFNLIGALDRFIAIAEAMGEKVEGLPRDLAAAKAVEAVRRLSRDIGIPTGLRQVGVTEDAIPAMADDAISSGNIQVNPRHTTREDLVALFRKAM